MEKTSKDKIVEHAPLTGDISPASKDKWDRTSNIALSLLQRVDQLEAFVAEQKIMMNGKVKLLFHQSLYLVQ